jgi:hypothetical protein
MTPRFLIQVTSLSLLCSAGIIAWNQMAPAEKQLNALWFILALFILLTIGIHHFLVRSAEKKPGAFVNTFMAATSLKLFLYLMVLVLFCLFNRQKAVVFIMGFLIIYFAFTAFEVIILLKFLQKKGNSP